MRKSDWKKWAYAILSGGVTFQLAGCGPETAMTVSAIASVLTAGGVLYLVWRVGG